ncbi:TetR/AcrR family transcriptional regulator [Paracoccus aminophilus]|uniref:Transcriptional regulator, TetR family n=1 Tax=Paracoccus aminophilus JCM 7686 TaxID=1367847 RepID=S5XZR4_PARAH|nr:TetR/AcrR family transcriptional regulator [Paracoccus aminophilus]AGT10782.1 transcriptional regulator, TetR family [Paracoccus aminophilus JCM 7686]
MAKERPQMRADGAQNRQAILAAARAVFAETGTEAPLELIANRAGVSRMTLYRHFPDRSELILEIFEANIAEFETYAQSHLGQDDAIFALLELVALGMHEHREMSLAAHLNPTSHPRLSVMKARLVTLLLPHMAAAARAGLIASTDLASDLGLMLDAIAGAMASVPEPELHAQAARLIALLRHGLSGGAG